MVVVRENSPAAVDWGSHWGIARDGLVLLGTERTQKINTVD